jgi:hypothetical protein
MHLDLCFLDTGTSRKSAVTLADVGTGACILMPIQMLIEHVDCNNVSDVQSSSGITALASKPQDTQRRSERGQIPRVCLPIDSYESEDDDKIEEEPDPECEIDQEWDAIEEEIDDKMRDLILMLTLSCSLLQYLSR